jgi:hypothetical protein
VHRSIDYPVAFIISIIIITIRVHVHVFVFVCVCVCVCVCVPAHIYQHCISSFLLAALDPRGGVYIAYIFAYIHTSHTCTYLASWHFTHAEAFIGHICRRLNRAHREREPAHQWLQDALSTCTNVSSICAATARA